MVDFEELSFGGLATPPAVFAALAGLVAIPLGQHVLLDFTGVPTFIAVGIASSLTGVLAFLLTTGVAYTACKHNQRPMPWWLCLPFGVGSVVGTLAALPFAIINLFAVTTF